MMAGRSQGDFQARHTTMASSNRGNPGSGFGGPRYPGTFMLALREAFARLNWQTRRWLGDAVDCTDAAGREQVLALENLYRRVRSVDRGAWPDLLVEFLSQIPDEALVNPPGALADVAERLFVRLGPPFAPNDAGLEIWSHRIAGSSLVATLVVDYPNSMSYVTVQMIADSGQDGEFWLARAVENLRGKTPAGCVTEIHAESGLMQCEVNDAYDSSRALILDDMLPGHEDDGFFVALPGRDHLLVLTVSAARLPFLPWLRSVAVRTHRNIPYPISSEIFWVCGGVWHPFVIELQGDKAMVNPPEEFLEVLRRIAPDLPEEPMEEPGEGEVPI
jgi:hypothetical protein